MNLPIDIRTRRTIEDKAAKIGVQRRSYETGLNRNNREVRALLTNAEGAGVSLGQLAALLGISRQTLTKWRDEATEQPRRVGRLPRKASP